MLEIETEKMSKDMRNILLAIPFLLGVLWWVLGDGFHLLPIYPFGFVGGAVTIAILTAIIYFGTEEEKSK